MEELKRPSDAFIVNRLGINPEVAGFAVFHTVKPFLRMLAVTVKPRLDLGNWLKSFCPVCGNKATTARIDGSDGKRYLLCRYCETEWLFKLLACPWCDNEDHRSLAFLQIEDTPGYALHVCEQGRGYLKVVDEKNGGFCQMPAAEMTTIYLDILAQQQGYYNDAANI